MVTALVVENDPTNDARRLGEWLADAGLALDVVRPHVADPLPESLDGHEALVVLGGFQHAYGPDRPAWFPVLEGLLRKAVRYRVPALGVCLGGQLLATAHGGTVERSPAGPEIGPGLIARRDAAERDPLFARVPFTPDVIQWHHDEITALPAGSVLLATSTRYANQAYRLGDRAWGTQFHLECDAQMVAGWVSDNLDLLAEVNIDPETVVAATAAILPDVEDVWQPFAARFAALARGEPAQIRPSLPVIT